MPTASTSRRILLLRTHAIDFKVQGVLWRMCGHIGQEKSLSSRKRGQNCNACYGADEERKQGDDGVPVQQKLDKSSLRGVVHLGQSLPTLISVHSRPGHTYDPLPQFAPALFMPTVMRDVNSWSTNLCNVWNLS